MKNFLLVAALLLIAACAVPPPPLCDREAQEWNKFDTQEDLCEPTWVPPFHKEWPKHGPKPSHDDPDVTPPENPDESPDTDSPDGSDDDDSEPADHGNGGPRGNNGWGNGDQDPPGNSGPHNNAENAVD